MAQIPGELEEAARIDGCSDWVMFWRVMFPITAGESRPQLS
jgi:ABC-type glycerol-3-phosphate transport system permease component